MPETPRHEDSIFSLANEAVHHSYQGVDASHVQGLLGGLDDMQLALIAQQALMLRNGEDTEQEAAGREEARQKIEAIVLEENLLPNEGDFTQLRNSITAILRSKVADQTPVSDPKLRQDAVRFATTNQLAL